MERRYENLGEGMGGAMARHSREADCGLRINKINTEPHQNHAVFAAVSCHFTTVSSTASPSDGVLRSPPVGMREIHK